MLNGIQPFDIITILHGSVFISLAHWLPRCWFNFCVLFENYRSKLNKTIPLVFPFLLLSPLRAWSVSGMKKQKPTFGAFVFQLIPCKCAAPILLFFHSKAPSLKPGCERNCLWFSTDFPVLLCFFTLLSCWNLESRSRSKHFPSFLL